MWPPGGHAERAMPRLRDGRPISWSELLGGLGVILHLERTHRQTLLLNPFSQESPQISP